MKRFLGAVLATILLAGVIGRVRADDKDPNAILDKAIKAIGGEEKLKKAESLTWKSKGSITFGGNDNDIKLDASVQGLDHYRAEGTLEINGETRSILVVLKGDKGWRKFGDEPMEMDDDAVTNEKRSIYLSITPMTLVPLKGKGFKLAAAPEEKVDGKEAVAIKVTGPDGKDFTLSFDKESGLPVKLVAKVIGFGGEEFTQESTFKNYKEFGGIKKATKVESKRDGEDFIKSEITDFKVVDKLDPKTFDEPK